MQQSVLIGTREVTDEASGEAVHLDGGTIFVGGASLGGFAFAVEHGHVIADAGLPRPATPGSLAITRGRVTTEDLNVRAGPGTKFEVVRQLELGAEVTLVGRTDGWVALESGGWVFYSSEWVDLEDDLELLQVVTLDGDEAGSES